MERENLAGDGKGKGSEGAMRKGRFSEEQMVAIIREADRDPVVAVAKQDRRARRQQRRVRRGLEHRSLNADSGNPLRTLRRLPASLRRARCLFRTRGALETSVQHLGKNPALASVGRPHIQDEGDGAREVHDFGVAVFAGFDPARSVHGQRDVGVI